MTWEWDPEELAAIEGPPEHHDPTSLPEALIEALQSINQAVKYRGRNRDPSVLNIPYPEYLQTPHWLALRQRMLAKAGYQCQRCRATDRRLDVHHLTYDRMGREPDGDLRVLCFQCHAAEHGK